MSSDELSTAPIVPAMQPGVHDPDVHNEVPADPLSADAGQATRKGSRTTAIVTACAILALPISYLALRRTDSTQAASATVVAAPSIPALEAATRASPTTANRINLSLAYINGNAPGRAVPVLQMVIQSEPNNLLAWNNLCVAHTLQQEFKAALEECARAVEIDPNFQLAKNNLKWTEDENGKALKTIADMEQTAIAQRDVKFYLAEGNQFLHVGNYDQSIKAWQRVLDLDPKNAIAENNIGTSYMFEKQPAIGLQWFEKSIATDPGLLVARNNIAWANDEIAKQK